MKMKFIAYNPRTGEKVKLIPHIRYTGPDKTKTYYSDGKNNYVFNPALEKAFELNQYVSIMEVEIAKKRYYLIGENE